jgi:hypothetical protein
VSRDNYKQLLEDMRKRLSDLLEQQEDTEQEIAQLKQAILSIAPLAKEKLEHGIWDIFGINSRSITETIREILQAAYPKRLSPVEIRDQLKNRKLDLSQHRNVMASIHSTLKRMFDNEEIVTDDEGLTYGWHRKYKLAEGTTFEPLLPVELGPTKTLTHSFRPTPTVDVSKKK